MKDIKKILFPTDFSKASNAAAANAVALARLFGAELTVLHADLLFDESREETSVDPDEGFQLLNSPEDEIDAAMCRQMDRLNLEGLDIRYKHARGVTAARTILSYMDGRDYQIVVMGTHGRRGFKRWLMGSVAEELVRFSPCPVITVKEKWAGLISEAQKILVPMDFSLASRAALKNAHLLAELLGARLELLHVIQPPAYPEVYAWTTSEGFYTDAQSKSKRLLEDMASELGDTVPTTIHTIIGYPTHEILQTAQALNVDLVLMAHMGLTRMAGRPLGAVTEHIVRAAECPVLTAELGEL